MKHMANLVTGSRILLSFLLLLVPPFAPSFYVLYILCGVTDMIDGPIARKTGSESALGAHLDSIADALFVLICTVRILPAVEILPWIWVWIGLIAILRAFNLLQGLARQKRLIMLHTAANKITGGLLFALPLVLHVININLAAIPICAAATFASVQEWHRIRTDRFDELKLR